MKHVYSIVGLMITGLLACATAAAAEHTVGQKDKQFVDANGKMIKSISIKKGDIINFKNMDPWFHNVFSLSDIAMFDLGSYPQNESKAVTFDTPGAGDVECAIHPHMLIKVEVK